MTETPMMMQVHPTDETAWWGVELPGRPRGGTYTRSSFEELPPAPAEDECARLEFLGEVEEPDGPMAEQATLRLRTWTTRVLNELNARNLPVPAGFERFFSTMWYTHALPSCTACYCMFEEMEDPEFFDTDDGATLLPFYSDQQGVLYWSLYLHPDGTHHVVTGDYPDPQRLQQYFEDDEVPEDERWNLYLPKCAESFAEFVWRWWMENKLWFITLEDGARPTHPARVAYLDALQRTTRDPG